MTRPAVVLLSGGLDSATVAAMARADGFEVHALSFAYGPRHTGEPGARLGGGVAAASRGAAALGVAEHRIVEIDLRAFGGWALTDDAIEVPKRRSAAEL